MRRTKTGSSRRKGDEYQDLTALYLVLESYIDRRDFQVFIEYEKAGALDDVVVIFPDKVAAYQVKHAVSDNAVYVPDDFTDSDSVVFIKKFATSWKKLATEFPNKPLELYLRSNRALDAQLADVVTENGCFDDQFRQNNYRKDKRKLRQAIFESTGLQEQEFQEFITSFHFDLKRPSWLELEKHIKAVQLDHGLGISDRLIFADLKRLIEQHAIETAAPITLEVIDSFLRTIQTRYLLPQSFFVDKERFVKPPTLKEQLDDQLIKVDGEYIVVTGPPGSGKSTALTEYCDELEESASDRFIIVRYYCFIRVQDNHQQLRLEAKSLRVNLLTELQRCFPEVLHDRRFDFSEDQFHEALEKIARHCGDEKKKLVVFLDGLDHVERDAEIHDSVMAALPAKIPEHVVFLIGTQELNRWKPIALKEGREKRHLDMPLFSRDETYTYVTDKCGIAVPDDTMFKIFERSAGLPLYLQYLVEVLSSSSDPVAAFELVPAAVDSDIRSYYETLWAGFDADGLADARYLSSVLASLRFKVHEDELIAFQGGIPDTPRFEAAYRRVRHLLRRSNTLVSVFHNSFREFVLENTNTMTLKEIASGIISRLKQEELQSARWFKYAFRYALEAGEFDYVLSNVNRKFVDEALMRFRSEDEIMAGIECGIEVAGTTADLVALSRIGTLKNRTHERLEYTFPWSVLTEILLYEGRVDQVVDKIYSEEYDKVLAGEEYSLQIMLKLFDLGMTELGGKLFSAFLKDFHGNSELEKNGIVTLAQCAGVYKTHPVRVMRWLASTELKPGILETEELSIEYAPHLAAYLDGLVRTGLEKVWHRLKKLNSPFSNQLMRQLLIRALANWSKIDQLHSEVDEYVAAHPDDTNIELGFYAAKSGFPAEFVSRLAGQFDAPPEVATHEMHRTDLQSHILRFAHWAVVFGYEQNDNVFQELRTRITKSEAVWTCTQLHLLKVGEVLGNHFANREIDWYCFATEAIEELKKANNVPGERTPDALSAARSILDRSLRWLSDVVMERCQAKISEWVALLNSLRSSFIWTTHYGIGESMTDYSFEFEIWEKQADLPLIRRHLRPVFLDCAKSYNQALSLKGGARGDHFLLLAALAAKCGFKNDVSQWLKRGIQTSLAYGYHKDVTLEKLTDLLSVLAKYNSEKVLVGAAEILEMIKWIPYATDGRCTKHFAQYMLPTIMTHNRAAALATISIYYNEFARWQADESLVKYILSCVDGDPEFLWALCGLLDPSQSLEPRQHVASLATSIDPSSADFFATRLSNYILTMINPRHWPDNLWDEAVLLYDRPARKKHNQNSSPIETKDKTYLIDGNPITEEEAIERCKSSFDEMVDTFGKLKKENDYIPDYKLFEILPYHIAKSANTDELELIELFFEKNAPWGRGAYWEMIGRKYLDLGNIPNGLKCIERTIHEEPMSESLNTLMEYDQKRATAFFISDLTERLMGPYYNGFDAPNVVANVCDVLGDGDAVEEVFDDFLLHCQELFSQWPKDRSFEQLRNWGDADCNECTQILHLLIDRLAANAAEFGHRLVCTICSLAECRAEKVFPILSERFASANGLLLWRLFQIYFRLSYTNKDLLLKHCQELSFLLKRRDVFLALSASQSIKLLLGEDEVLEGKLKKSIDEVDRRYSSFITYRGFRILKTAPSNKFVELTHKGAHLSFDRQLTAICEILDVDKDSITAQIERQLLATGATLEEEKVKARSMWNAYSHAQGWPIIWPISDFHVTISHLLYQAIDEILVKQRYQQHHLEAVWRVIQQSDPEYSDTLLIRKPEDIAPLFVHDKDEWISLKEEAPSVVIEDSMTDEWIIAFEFRQLGHDSPYHCEFMMQTHVRSTLVIPPAVDQIDSFGGNSWGEKVGTHHPAENLTWQQFREALRDGHQLEPEEEMPCLPFVSYRQRKPGFLGFHTMVSLSSWLIREHNLRLDGFAVFDNDEHIAQFEAWQEGYSDEDYKDDPLTFGVRFRVRKEFIEKVCRYTGRAFAIRTIENRFVLKDFQGEPSESNSNTSIRVWPMVINPSNT